VAEKRNNNNNNNKQTNKNFFADIFPFWVSEDAKLPIHRMNLRKNVKMFTLYGIYIHIMNFKCYCFSEAERYYH